MTFKFNELKPAINQCSGKESWILTCEKSGKFIEKMLFK